MDIETRMQANELLMAATIAALNAVDPLFGKAIRHAVEQLGATLADRYPAPSRPVSIQARRLALDTIGALIPPSR